MVRVTTVLARIPIIKFRKGGPGSSAAAPAATVTPTTPGPVAAPAPQAQQAAAMSTGSISDIDLPAKYQRRPLSQEEIDHINGGGIV